MRRPLKSVEEWAEFQRLHAGDHETKLTSGRPADGIWADGISVDPDTVVAVEAKFISKPNRSMYEGKAHPAMQERLMKDFDAEVERYGKAIRHRDNPVGRLRLVVSTAAAGDYLGARARRLLGPKIDVDVQVRPENSTVVEVQVRFEREGEPSFQIFHDKDGEVIWTDGTPDQAAEVALWICSLLPNEPTGRVWMIDEGFNGHVEPMRGMTVERLRGSWVNH